MGNKLYLRVDTNQGICMVIELLLQRYDNTLELCAGLLLNVRCHLEVKIEPSLFKVCKLPAL